MEPNVMDYEQMRNETEQKWQQEYRRQEVKGACNKLVGGLLLYTVIMSSVVVIDMIVRMVIVIVDAIKANENLDNALDKIDLLDATGTSSILGVTLGVLFLFLFFKREQLSKMFLKKSEKKMTASSFFTILCIFLSAQMLYIVITTGLEWVFNLAGLSLMKSLEVMDDLGSTVSLFLYASFVGPIAEELVFRGFLLQGLKRFGKPLAIVVTAILFGAMHGNIPQGIFATLVGLVLGYVAMEYSIYWSMLLHIINNFVVSEGLTWLLKGMSDEMQAIIQLTVFGIILLIAIVLLIKKRGSIKAYREENRVEKGLYKYCFTSACTIVFLVMQVVSMLIMIQRL